MTLMRETRDREGAGHKGAVARLQQENLSVLAELNAAKRELKNARGAIDRLQVRVRAVSW